MEIIDRKTARLKKLNYYFTGAPCKHGHLALRYTINTGCTQCHRECARMWARDHKIHRVNIILSLKDKLWLSERAAERGVSDADIMRELLHDAIAGTQ